MSATAVFLMSCGSPEFRFPDEWMTTPARVSEAVADTHISKWWSSACPHQIHGGEVAVLVATTSGKVMGAFEVEGDPVEDRSHPHDPNKWPWTVPLRPLVLLDGTLAPLLRDFGLTAPHKYKRVNEPVASKLLRAIHPELGRSRMSARTVIYAGEVDRVQARLDVGPGSRCPRHGPR